MSAQPADAAVVIVHYRRPDLTNACLRSLGVASKGLKLETVVIDNASGDGSADELEPQNAETRVISLGENRGFAAGVNEGFAQSSAPIVVVLNPDTEPQPESITRLVEHLRRNPSVGVAGPILLHRDGRFQRSAHRRFPNLFTTFITFCMPLGYVFPALPWHPHELTEAESLRGGAVAHVGGAAFAVRRAAYAAAGRLDERFFLYLEETEWQRRVHEAGWRIDVVPKARVVHLIQGGETSADTPSLRYVESLYHYMDVRGVSEGLVDATLVTATSVSSAHYWAVGKLFPGRRAAATRLCGTYRGYLDYVLERRRRRRASVR